MNFPPQQAGPRRYLDRLESVIPSHRLVSKQASKLVDAGGAPSKAQVGEEAFR